MKFLFFSLTCLFSTSIFAQATDVEGYVIKNTGDTVKGTVEITYVKSLFNKEKTIDFGDMEFQIKFTEKGGKSRKWKAGEINGFGFSSGGEWYHFEFLDLAKNYGQKAPKMFFKTVNDFKWFILRIYDGVLPIYYHYSRNYDENKATGYYTRTGDSHGLLVKMSDGKFDEIAPTTLGGNKKFKEYLKNNLKLEDEFLKTVDDKAKFSDAETILKRYNDWEKAGS